MTPPRRRHLRAWPAPESRRRGRLLPLLLVAGAAVACEEPPERSPPDGGAPVFQVALDGQPFLALSAWADSPADLFVVGGLPGVSARALRYDGSRWQDMDTGATDQLWWVFGLGPRDVFAAGERGAIVHFDGERWAPQDSTTERTIFGVWGAAADDVWAVGGKVGPGAGVILHYDGLAWTEQEGAGLELEATVLFKVWGADASHVFAVGDRGAVLRYDGLLWTREPVPVEAADEPLISVFGRSESDVYAVGGLGQARVLHRDGERWSLVVAEGAQGLNGVFARPDSAGAIVVGFGGFAARVDPTGLVERIETPSRRDLHGLFGFGEGELVATGGNLLAPETPAGTVLYLGRRPPAATIEPFGVPAVDAAAEPDAAVDAGLDGAVAPGCPGDAGACLGPAERCDVVPPVACRSDLFCATCICLDGVPSRCLRPCSTAADCEPDFGPGARCEFHGAQSVDKLCYTAADGLEFDRNCGGS